jgi:hypothetical protein
MTTSEERVDDPWSCTRGLDPVVEDRCTIAKLERLRNEGAGRGGGSGSSEAGGVTRSLSLPSCEPAASSYSGKDVVFLALDFGRAATCVSTQYCKQHT